MPITLFNPPCPHADPVRAGLAQNGHRCGDCICVPRYWKVSSDTPSGANDLAQAVFGPSFVLTRELSQFRTDASDNCQWTTQFPVPDGIGSWTVMYGSIAPPGGGLVATGWLAIAGGPTPFPLNEVAAYLADPTQMFRCLEANDLLFLPPPDSGGFNVNPSTVTITPFWP